MYCIECHNVLPGDPGAVICDDCSEREEDSRTTSPLIWLLVLFLVAIAILPYYAAVTLDWFSPSLDSVAVSLGMIHQAARVLVARIRI